MSRTFYLDESGNTGDAINTGVAFDFSAQPVFVLAAVGVDEASAEIELTRLKAKHRIQSAELKSASVFRKLHFIIDVQRFMQVNGLPFFIEAVDKRFFICANMIDRLVIPALGPSDLEPNAVAVKNVFADYLYAAMPPDVMQAYLDACAQPHAALTRAAFRAMLNWLEPRIASNQVAAGLHLFASDTFRDFEAVASAEGSADRAFLPIPDEGKHGKPYWMLPNLTSFTNIYARINLYCGRDLSGVRLIHDEQLQFDLILADAKAVAERLAAQGLTSPLPHADFAFVQQALLSFESSTMSAGIQFADVLAGFVMRYVQEIAIRQKPLAASYMDAFRNLLEQVDPARGVGLNFVLPHAGVARLGVVPTVNKRIVPIH